MRSTEGNRSTVYPPLFKNRIQRLSSRSKPPLSRRRKILFPSGGGKIPANLKLPLRDGDIDRPEDEAYAGCYFFNANSRQAPEIVDAQVQPILNQSEVYSGCYGRISVTFYGFSANGNRGIAAGLGNIQKLRDGDPLGGKTRAADDLRQKQMRISSLDRNTGGRRLPPAT